MRNICFLLIMAILGCNQAETASPVSGAQSSARVPKISLMDIDGHPVRLEDHIGKTVFINFWATWCKPCIEEMPSIEKAQELMRGTNVAFLLASSESAEEIKAFKYDHSYQLNYVQLENPETLNFQALPTTFIINAKGELAFSEMGSRKWDDSANINLIKNITTQHE